MEKFLTESGGPTGQPVDSFSPNAAARGMMEKAGLRKEGEFVQSWFDGNAWVNVSWYALLNEERAARA